ncbi:hypothetical protein PWT90_08499 [Aphanocladium album]|nr:hypothetical protein PWT90_08499 [Aphanocladium album]
MPLPIAHTVEDYTIGWVCALAIELAAAKRFLDSEHPRIHPQQVYDDNGYVLGRIAQHNAVPSLLPQGIYGKVSAATVAQQIRATIPIIRLCLVVGIGGGVPFNEDSNDVRLGDVVYTGSMNAPHHKFLTATGLMKAAQAGTSKAPAFDELVRNVIADPEAGTFHRCSAGPMDDRLF